MAEWKNGDKQVFQLSSAFCPGVSICGPHVRFSFFFFFSPQGSYCNNSSGEEYWGSWLRDRKRIKTNVREEKEVQHRPLWNLLRRKGGRSEKGWGGWVSSGEETRRHSCQHGGRGEHFPRRNSVEDINVPRGWSDWGAYRRPLSWGRGLGTALDPLHPSVEQNQESTAPDINFPSRDWSGRTEWWCWWWGTDRTKPTSS